ncbi:MAG: four helix bundle protein [Patescibacteria group bacterium]
MSQGSQKLQKFEDMPLWQDSLEFATKIYKLTSSFPQNEKFGLIPQLRRAAYSISANVAEGFGIFSKKDKHHFYTIAYGSLLEVKNFLYLAERLNYLAQTDLSPLIYSIELLQKQLNSLMKSIRT